MLILEELLDANPNPVFVVEPIIENNTSNNFYYRYVNKAFCLFIGKLKEELIDNTFFDVFKSSGEKEILNLFLNTVLLKKPKVEKNSSFIIDKEIVMSTYPVSDRYCACEILDFNSISNADDKLLEKATKDYLTKFYNRHYLQEYFVSIKENTPYGLIFLDVNNLKTTNDTLGHKAGDKLLIDFCNIVSKYFKDYKHFRIGGDEFVCLCVGEKENIFINKVENFKKYLDSNNLASIGFKYYENKYNINKALDECDKLMYIHKHEQKNINNLK